MKLLRRVLPAAWLLLKWVPGRAWGWAWPLLETLVETVASVVSSAVIAVAVVAVIVVAIVGVVESAQGGSASDAASQGSGQQVVPPDQPEKPPSDNSKICSYAKRPLVDSWTGPLEPVDSLIITEVGSTEQAQRPPNVDKWNLDMGGDAAPALLELADPLPLLGSWLVRVKLRAAVMPAAAQPQSGAALSAAQVRVLVDHMLADDQRAAHGPGCQYAGIELNAQLEEAGLSGEHDQDYALQRHLRAEGADFVGAWDLVRHEWLGKGHELSPVTVAVIDHFRDVGFDMFAGISRWMPVDVSLDIPLEEADLFGSWVSSQHGDRVASVMFWPDLRDLPGVGALRMHPAAERSLHYMPVPLNTATSTWEMARALLAVSGFAQQPKKGQRRPRAPSPMAQVINVSLSKPVALNTPALPSDEIWYQAVSKVRELKQAPVIVISGGGRPGQRNLYADAPVSLTVAAYAELVDHNNPVLRSGFDPTAPGRQVAASGESIEAHDMDRLDERPRVVSGFGSSFAAPQASAVAAMLLAIKPGLSANEVASLVQCGSGRRKAYAPDQAWFLPVLNARTAVEELLQPSRSYCALI